MQLSHKSFRCPKWLEFTLAYCGALAFEGDPIEWSKNHNWCVGVAALPLEIPSSALCELRACGWLAERCDAPGLGQG